MVPILDVPYVVFAGSLALITALAVALWGVTGSRAVAGEEPGLPTGTVDRRQAMLESGALDRAIKPAVNALARQARRLTPTGWLEGIDTRLKQAGSPAKWTLERVLALKLVLGTLGGVGGAMFVNSELSGPSIAVAVLLAVGGFVLPDVILHGRARERQQLIQVALPDTLDQMTISVEAGLGFDAALKRVAGSGDGPLAEELMRTLGEIKVGVARRQALKNLGLRTNVAELRGFVVAVQQAEEYGLPIAKILRVQANELRIKRRQRAEERALKMPVKIVFPLVFCIFPAMFVVLLGPAVIRIIRTLF